MFQESFLWLAKQDVTGEDLKVFMAMTSKMDFKNFIRFSQTQLAEEIRIPRPNGVRYPQGRPARRPKQNLHA